MQGVEKFEFRGILNQYAQTGFVAKRSEKESEKVRQRKIQIEDISSLDGLQGQVHQERRHVRKY